MHRDVSRFFAKLAVRYSCSKTKLNIVPFSFFLILDVGQPIAVSLHQLPMLCNEVDHGDIPSCRNNALGQERLWSSGHG